MSASLLSSKINKVARLAAALALSASIGVVSADRAAACGGGGGGGGGHPQAQAPAQKTVPPDAAKKLRTLHDFAKRLKSEIRLGERGPLTNEGVVFLQGQLRPYDQYVGTPEYDQALSAITEAENAQKGVD
jgi:hypothetical protein